MYARVLTASLLGLDCEKVWVEADVENGLSSFSIVGLADQSIRESKDRIRSAIVNCGFSFPDIRLTVNMTPAGIKKAGSHFDLAIAAAVLLSSGSLNTDSAAETLSGTAILGELGLDGKVSYIEGALPMVIGLRKAGIRRIVLPEANFGEASLVRDLKFFPVNHIRQLIDHLSGEAALAEKSVGDSDIFAEASCAADFVDIRGQESLKRAAQIAAAGCHGMLVVGPPGVGKSMLGKRIAGILPPLSYEQQLEVTQIYSIAGKLSPERPIIKERPFRSPHHSMSATAMAGGGVYPKPGEVSLAHGGVLFLDELPEFSPAVLETLRQPLEDGKVSIVRVFGKYSYPARFMLVAAMNPCRCGYFGDPVKRCNCTDHDRQRYMNKISGALLDRIDLHISAQRPSYTELSYVNGDAEVIDTKTLRAGVMRAFEIQRERYRGLAAAGLDCNARLEPAFIKRFCHLDRECEALMKEAFRKWSLSARSYHRIVKLARTIADLEASASIKPEHILEALSYRMPDKFFR